MSTIINSRRVLLLSARRAVSSCSSSAASANIPHRHRHFQVLPSSYSLLPSSSPSQLSSCAICTPHIRSLSSSTFASDNEVKPDTSSAAASPNNKRGRRQFIPRKAAIALTPKARTFFHSLLDGVSASKSTNDNSKDDNDDDDPIIGIQLTYAQSTSGQPRMVFGFSFLRSSNVHAGDEAVSLEVLDDGVTPKPPAEALEDGLPKLYVHRDAVLKVLGATLDVDEVKLMPILYDKEGNVMDPNA